MASGTVLSICWNTINKSKRVVAWARISLSLSLCVQFRWLRVMKCCLLLIDSIQRLQHSLSFHVNWSQTQNKKRLMWYMDANCTRVNKMPLLFLKFLTWHFMRISVLRTRSTLWEGQHRNYVACEKTTEVQGYNTTCSWFRRSLVRWASHSYTFSVGKELLTRRLGGATAGMDVLQKGCITSARYRIPDRPAHSLVTTPTTLPQLRLQKCQHRNKLK